MPLRLPTKSQSIPTKCSHTGRYSDGLRMERSLDGMVLWDTNSGFGWCFAKPSPAYIALELNAGQVQTVRDYGLAARHGMGIQHRSSTDTDVRSVLQQR